MSTDLPPEGTPESPAPTPETPPAPETPPQPAAVSLSQEEYDRLKAGAAMGEQVAPYLDVLKGLASPPPEPEPVLGDEDPSFNDNFYTDPRTNIQREARRIIEKEYAPGIEKTRRDLQLQTNLLVIEQFKAEKRAGDQFANGVMPLFDKIVASTPQKDLANIPANNLRAALENSWKMAKADHLEAQALVRIKDAAPPIGGAPVGGLAGAGARDVMPTTDEFEALVRLGSAYGKTREQVFEVWKKEQEAVNNA